MFFQVAYMLQIVIVVSMVEDSMCSKMTSDEIILRYLFHFHNDSGKGEERRGILLELYSKYQVAHFISLNNAAFTETMVIDNSFSYSISQLGRPDVSNTPVSKIFAFTALRILCFQGQ